MACYFSTAQIYMKLVRGENRLFSVFFFLDLTYSFDRGRDSQWEREHKQGEWERKKQSPSRRAQCGARAQNFRITPWAEGRCPMTEPSRHPLFSVLLLFFFLPWPFCVLHIIAPPPPPPDRHLRKLSCSQGCSRHQEQSGELDRHCPAFTEFTVWREDRQRQGNIKEQNHLI